MRKLFVQSMDGRRQEIQFNNGNEIYHAAKQLGLIKGAFEDYNFVCSPANAGTDIINKRTGKTVHVGTVNVPTGQYAHYGEVVSI